MNTLAAFAGEHPQCWLCKKPAQIHHICGRNSPDKDCRANLFAACRRCHDEIIPVMDIGLQAAIKAWCDPEGHDEAALRELRRRKNGRIDL